MKKIKLSILFVFSLIACGDPSPQVHTAAFAAQSMALHLSVDGMVCRSCEHTIKTTLLKLPGVSEVKASHAQKSVDVTFDPSLSSKETIVNAIKELGYTIL